MSTLAYLLVERMRAAGLAGPELARATAGRRRLKLLKVAAQVRISVRRGYVQLSRAWPPGATPLRSAPGVCASRAWGVANLSDHNL